MFTVLTEDGTTMDEDIINAMLELDAEVIGECSGESQRLIRERNQRLAHQQQLVEEANKQFYLEECEKLDACSEDLKEALQRAMKDLKKAISEKKKEMRASTHLPLGDIIAIKDEVNRLEKKRKQMQRDIYAQEDEIDMQKDRLQEEIRQKLNGNSEVTHIMTISFEKWIWHLLILMIIVRR